MEKIMTNSKIIYINSYERSGSTLLGMLLGLHPDIINIGEIRNLEDYYTNNKKCFCGLEVKNCDWWKKILNTEQIDINNFLMKTKSSIIIKIMTFISLLPFGFKIIYIIRKFNKSIKNEITASENILKIYNIINKKEKPKFIVDSSKRFLQANCIKSKIKDEVYLIRLVRDGRGVANSIKKRKGNDFRPYLKKWKRTNKLSGLLYNKFSKNRRYFIRYEDFTSNYQSEINKLFEFIGLSKLDFTEVSDRDCHFIGGSSTLRDRKMTIENIISDDSWKKNLSEKELSIFNKIAGKLNKKYGYN